MRTSEVDDQAAAEFLGATGEGLLVVARTVEGPIRGPVSRAAATFERAGRLPYQSAPVSSARRQADVDVSLASRDLRRAVRSVARSGMVADRDDTGAALELVAALMVLAAAAAELHRARGDAHSATAAIATVERLDHWRIRPLARPAGPPSPGAPVKQAGRPWVPPTPGPPARGR